MRDTVGMHSSLTHGTEGWAVKTCLHFALRFIYSFGLFNINGRLSKKWAHIYKMMTFKIIFYIAEVCIYFSFHVQLKRCIGLKPSTIA